MCTISDVDIPNNSCVLFDFLVCAVLIGIISVCGLLGNATSFLVLCKHRPDASAVFLLQVMAIADSVLLISTLFVYSFPAIYPYTRQMSELFHACREIKIYVWPIAMMSHTATIWMTVLVTLNRFGAICRPLGTFRKHGESVRIKVCFVISLSVLYNVPRFFEHQPLGKHVQLTSDNGFNGSSHGNTSEPFYLGDSQLYQIIYSNILYFPVMYIVPLLTLGYLNIRLVRSLTAIKMKKETLTGHRPREDHITLCIIVIVCVFIFCQTPALINQIFWAALDKHDRQCGQFHFYYTKLSDALVVLNSSCNFVIYCLFGKSFRKIFLDTLCGRQSRARENGDTCLYDMAQSNNDVPKRCVATCTTEDI